MAGPRAKSWDRFPDEISAAFEAFKIYRALKQPRQLAKVAEARGLSIHTIEGYSSMYEWAARAKDYDDYLDKKMQQGAATFAKNEGEKRARRQLKVARLMQEVAAKKLLELVGRQENGNGVFLSHEVNANHAARLAKEGVHIERLVSGEATERVETKIDLSKLSDEELAQLDALNRKARGEA